MSVDAASQLSGYIAVQGEIRSRGNQAWARWLARAFDILLFTIPAIVLYLLLVPPLLEVLPSWAGSKVGLAVLDTMSVFLVIILVEPVLIAATETTPGKWLMGIRVHHLDGRRLSYLDAVGRTSHVMVFGLVFGLPILQFIASVLGRSQLLTDGSTIWERLSGGFAHHRSRPMWVWAPMFLVVIGCRIALVLLSQQA